MPVRRRYGVPAIAAHMAIYHYKNGAMMANTPNYAGQTATTRGPIGKPTSAGMQILLTIVTLGIWAYVWTYRQHRDIKAYSGEGVDGVLGLVILFFLGFVTPFLLDHEIEANLYGREGQQSPVHTITGLWILLPLVGSIIWYVKTQSAINDFWIARGASAP